MGAGYGSYTGIEQRKPGVTTSSGGKINKPKSGVARMWTGSKANGQEEVTGAY